MVQVKRIESFIKRAVHKLTRSGNTVKYIPKSIKNGVVIGDCAVLLNKQQTYDVFSKQRQPIKRDIANRKVAICIATLMNQFTEPHRDTLDKLLHLDKEYAVNYAECLRHKHKPISNQDALEYLQDRLAIIVDKIDDLYKAMTL
tara:strand:- start:108 stop:539 length:432 start_codon:yes stop_codon:yes gene_type:complete